MTWKKGQSGNPAGRPKLPEWFRNGGDDALRVIYASATGREPPGENPPAVTQYVIGEDGVDKCAKPEDRPKHAIQMVERIYGKTPDKIDVEGDMTLTITRRIVDPKAGA